MVPLTSTPLMRVWAVKGTKLGVRHFVNLAAADAVFLLGQHDDAAAFRRFVGEAGELGRLGEFLRRRRPARG